MFGPSSALACDPPVVHGVGRVSQPPGSVKEGTSGLGNPRHGFYTDVNAMAEIPRVSVLRHSAVPSASGAEAGWHGPTCEES